MGSVRQRVHAQYMFTVTTVLSSHGVFEVSESESGKELRLGGDSLARERFLCKREALSSKPQNPH